ncbi:MAG: GNAT family N-acetyltransferase [Solirubrobacteraceae bacterium]
MPADEAFLVEVYASTRPLELATLAGAPEAQAAFARSQSSFQHRAYSQLYPHAAFDLVLVDGTPVGRLYVDRGEAEIRLVDITLLPRYRGSGLGSGLLGSLQAEAAQRGVPLALHVDVANRARRLYARLGFVELAATEVHVLMRWTPPLR